jgi:hypothetical protein
MENKDVPGSKSPSRRAFLSASAATAITAPILMRAGSASAATVTPHPIRNNGNFDSDLRSLIRQIDPNRIQNTIQTLANFGTRHTLSSLTDPNRGIGPAYAWVFAQMQAIAATSNGNMTAQQQTFT